MSVLLRDTVERLRAPSTGDGYGNARPDWTNATAVGYPAEVQPLTTDENVVDQARTVTRWRLWLPPSADVAAADRIVWDGDTYEIDGDVKRWKRRGAVHHLEAILLRVSQG